ncbi:sodium/glutamate symporter [Candidatus Sororendozoicomonas aggregata]|uniref:sodium/glutamate symporter n=1 Tax=Candidatus Sororendozoicomonas aggregata TaxID=3073239 RepID=UPI002ED0D560
MTHLSGIHLLCLAILSLFIGHYITNKVQILKRCHIPSPVTGGLILSLGLTGITEFYGTQFHYDLQLRDLLLLGFFGTIGLSARFRLLMSGGKTIAALMVVAIVFLIVQNTAGVATAMAMGENPIYGLLAGTITFAGGHGTAITWGNFLEQQGYKDVMEFGLVAATLGLILGGLLGGPVARKLISRYQLSGAPYSPQQHQTQEKKTHASFKLNSERLLPAIFLISSCIILGHGAQSLLKSYNIVLPEFVPVLFAGIIITNLSDLFKTNLHHDELNALGDICLQLFITMSLMTIKLQHLSSVAGVLAGITIVQVVVITLFAWFVVFRFAGKDYDSSVITAGFIGMGLGATPVGMANMNTLTHRYGPSTKAFLVIPLIGSFFIDIANAIILKGFLELPVFTG